MPEPQSDLAQEITKDPYNFDFVAIREDYSEKELKDALMDNITKFLMELGKGFAFVGREYTIPIEGTEEKIDLLFYHLYLHCYVVVEVKIVAASLSILNNSVVMDDGTDPERIAMIQRGIEQLSSKDITTQIDLLLEDKNSGLIDDASISMLRAFREGMFIGNGTPIPVSRYTDAS